MEGRDFEILEHIDCESLVQIEDKIRETESKIKELNEKKARLRDSGGGEAELNEVEEELREQTIRLDNFNKDRLATLGYLG